MRIADQGAGDVGRKFVDHPAVDFALKGDDRIDEPFAMATISSSKTRDGSVATSISLSCPQNLIRNDRCACPFQMGAGIPAKDLMRHFIGQQSRDRGDRFNICGPISSRNSRIAAAHGVSPGSMPPCGICHSFRLTSFRRPANALPAFLINMIPTLRRTCPVFRFCEIVRIRRRGRRGLTFRRDPVK